jgi:hypothetical protein
MRSRAPENDRRRRRGAFVWLGKLAWFWGTTASVPMTIAFVVTARPAVLYAESARYDAGPPVCDPAAVAACELDGGDGGDVGCTLRGASGRCVFQRCRASDFSVEHTVLTCVLPVPPAPPSAPTDQGQPTDPEVGGCASSPTTGPGDGLALASLTIGMTAIAWRRRRS